MHARGISLCVGHGTISKIDKLENFPRDRDETRKVDTSEKVTL